MEDNFPALMKAVSDKQLVKAVIVDTDFNLSVAKLLRAELYLKNLDCLFLVGTTDEYAIFPGNNKLTGTHKSLHTLC